MPLRVAASLAVCGLVGGALAASAGSAGRGSLRAAVVTQSNQIVEGVFRGSSADGIALGVGDRVRIVPWADVDRVSFEPAAESLRQRPTVIALSESR